MLQATTFLQEICAQPADLASRAAFADWLSEQPDAASRERGEFIAIQLRLDAGTARRQDRHDLRQRERELLERYEHDWTAPLRGLQRFDRFVFRNGMVEGVVTSAVRYLEACEQFDVFS